MSTPHLSTPHLARRRLSPDARQDAILRAAADAFAAAPFGDVSVAAIARACNASEALVYKYFGTKSALYAAVVKAQLDDLSDHQHAAVAALPVNSSARDLVRVLVEATLDQVADSGGRAASPFFTSELEPPAVTRLRQDFRDQFADELLARLRNPHWQRGRIGVTGFLGFLAGVAQDWAVAGCPNYQRGPLVEASLGALEGAIGDWDSLAPPR